MHPLSTRPFFESGYNNLSWVLPKNQEDRFFIDFKDLSEVPLMDLTQALQSALEDLSRRQPGLTFLDDGSVLSQAFLWLSRHTGIRMHSLTQFRKWDLEFVHRCSQDFGITDTRTLAYLQVTRELQTPVIWPQAFLRVLNVSFQRSGPEEYGAPYWVYLENERSHRALMALSSLRLQAVENLLKISPEVFKSYFFHFSGLWARESFPEPHNDFQERSYFRSLTDSETPLYLSFDPPTLNPAPSPRRFQQAAFPLRGFFRKYFKSQPDFNRLEDVFGSPY